MNFEAQEPSQFPYQDTIERSNPIVFNLDMNLKLESYNNEFDKFFSSQLQSLDSSGDIFKFFDSRDKEFWYNKYNNALMGLPDKFQKIFSNGQIFQIYLSPIHRDHRIVGINSFFEDITRNDKVFKIRKEFESFLLHIQKIQDFNSLWNRLESFFYRYFQNSISLIFSFNPDFNNFTLTNEILDYLSYGIVESDSPTGKYKIRVHNQFLENFSEYQIFDFQDDYFSINQGEKHFSDLISGYSNFKTKKFSFLSDGNKLKYLHIFFLSNELEEFELRYLELLHEIMHGQINRISKYNSLSRDINLFQNKINTKEILITGLCNEVRTPLNAVIGFAKIVKDVIVEETAKDYIDTIQVTSQKLLRLISDISDLSRIESNELIIQKDKVVLKEILDEIYHSFKSEAERKGLDFKWNLGDKLPLMVITDDVRFRQIITNILDYSFSNTDDGYISFYMTSTNVNDSMELIIEIQDSGKGISEEKLSHIFDNNYKLHEDLLKYNDLSLGLTLTGKLIRLMNGNLNLSSKSGKGSLFTITLHNVERAYSDAIKSGKYDIEVKKIKFENCKILIVDDVSLNRKLIKKYLKYSNLILFEAEDGKMAVDHTLLNKPDLILMDLRMPVMDGYEATRVIKQNEKLKNIPIVALTASTLHEDMKNIEEIGFSDYIKKPAKQFEIYTCLMRFLPFIIDDNPLLRFDSILLDPSAKERIPEFLSMNEDELRKVIVYLLANKDINLLRNFNFHLIDLGKEFRIPILIEIGNVLVSEMNVLDWEKIHLSLKQVSEVIEQLKTIVV